MVNSQQEAMNTARADEKAAQWIALVLAMISGYVDAYGFICYRTYLSFMSGNTTQSGLMTGGGVFPLAIPTLTAIVSFVVGVFAGTLFVVAGTNRTRRLKFGLVAALLGVNIAMTLLAAASSLVSIATLSFAMGVLNTTLSHFGAEAVNLTFVTGTLNKIGSHFALALKRAPLKDAQGTWDTHARRAFLLMALWVAFFVGAVLAGAATARCGAWVLLPPCVILLALMAATRVPSAIATSKV